MVTKVAQETGHKAIWVGQIGDKAKDSLALRRACERFEAFVVSYLLWQMWRAAEAVGEEKPFMSQAYRDLFTYEVAESLTPAMRLGIADALYRELSRSAFGARSVEHGAQGVEQRA